ncbi:hypothetical protein HAX54_051729, partial [Datura stramonium]|nr:hypothetical protein [Datura stramonium]
MAYALNNHFGTTRGALHNHFGATRGAPHCHFGAMGGARNMQGAKLLNEPIEHRTGIDAAQPGMTRRTGTVVRAQCICHM